MEYNTRNKSYQRNKGIKIANTSNQDEYMQVDAQTFQDALAYLDSELEKGYPIVVGVDHSYAYKGGGYNNDLTTDHFVVIVGRKYNEKGELYYLFYEVGTKHERNGISDDNKLYINNNVLCGKTAYKPSRKYFVTQIRLNQ